MPSAKFINEVVIVGKKQLSIDPPDLQPLETVEDYQFEPVGYPTLHWQGKRPFTSTQYYPAQLKEVHGEETNGWRKRFTGVIIFR